MRILIVEDDFVSRRILQRILEGHGECDVAVDGEEAVAAFNSAHEEGNPYKLVCLDINMPRLDGHGVLEAIRRFEDQVHVKGADIVQVVMTTGLEDKENFMKAFKQGFAGYITKPIDRDKLLTLLSSLNIS